MLAIRVRNAGTSMCTYFCVELVVAQLIHGRCIFSEYEVGEETERGFGPKITFDSMGQGPTPPGMTRHFRVPFAFRGMRKLFMAEGIPVLRDLIRVHVYADAKPREESWVRVQDIWKAPPVLKQVL